jgi:hypothetical protein
MEESMSILSGSRHRPALAVLALALGFFSPAAARADLLVNGLGDGPAPQGVAPQDTGHVAAAAGFGPHGPAATADRPDGAGGLLAFLVCVHPPIEKDPGGSGGSSGGTAFPGGGGGGTIIGSEGGSKGGGSGGGGGGGGGGVTGGSGGGGTIASVSPEPNSFVIGLLGVTVGGLTRLARRRRPALPD